MGQHDIEITGMTRVARPSPNGNFDTILAHMTLRIGPVELRGCAFVKRSTGYRTIWTPKLAKTHKNRGISITDYETKKRVIASAQAAFDTLERQSQLTTSVESATEMHNSHETRRDGTGPLSSKQYDKKVGASPCEHQTRIAADVPKNVCLLESESNNLISGFDCVRLGQTLSGDSLMRPINYLSDVAEKFGVQLKTLQIVDREFSEKGLRRKGSGRSIPVPSLRENLSLVLAANLLPEETPSTIVDAVRRWCHFPSIEGTPRLLESMKDATLIEGMERLCTIFKEDHSLVSQSTLELNKTLEVATIKVGREFVTFGFKPQSEPPQGQTIRVVSGFFFANVAPV